MKNQKKVFALILISLFVFMTGCTNKSNSESEKKNILSENILKSISEVSKNAYGDLIDAKEKYSNLEFDMIVPYCPDLNMVYDIKYYALDNYKGITNEADMLKEQLAFVEYVLEQPLSELNKEYFETRYYSFINREDYEGFDDFQNSLSDKDELEPSYLYYVDQSETKLRAVAIQRGLGDLFFFRGKCYEASYDYRVQSGSTTLTQPRFVGETIKKYYVYTDNNSLSDKHLLADGELSIQEGIDFVENYINNELKIDGSSDDIQLKVESVEVIKINKDYNCFRYRIRRNLKGVLFQPKNDGGSLAAINLNYDISDAYQVELNKLDAYNGSTRRINYDKVNEINNILPLSEAIKMLAENIGNNSKYQVNGIELGYLSIASDDTYSNGTATVCWVIKCINKLDESITEFYINVQTGEIKTYSRHQ